MTETTGPTIGLVLDCQDPTTLAQFWAAALHYVSLGEAGSYVVLLPDGRPGPKLLLQRVPEAKTVKNRMHLDIDAADIDAEARRLEGLGARRVVDDPVHEHDTSWILMADPEGNEFCVCDGGAPG
jgi:predicted enzyme related to lactoylglutathione lyase